MIVDLYLKVLNLSISAIPLMAALLALRLLFKKAVPRKVFYIAWVLVFLRLMVPFSLESDLSFFNIIPETTVVEENIGTSVVFVENENERVEFPVFVNPGRDNPNVDGVYHSAITGEIVTGPDITTVPMDKNQILGTVWIFGTAGLLLFGIIGYFAVLRKLKFESIEYTEKIRLSEFFRTPVVCGLIRPKIILPMNFDLDNEAKIKSVISHECTHIRRGDNLWRLLATFTLYVHWFNPLVWICYNAFIRDMEVSCDEAVLSCAKNDIRTEYAESLVALAGNGTNSLYGGVLSFGECAVKERVKCIMNFKKTTLLIVIICIAAAAALGVIFLTNPSVTEEENIHDFAVVLADGTEVSYSRENGIEMEAVITNNGEKTIWLDSATIVQAEINGEEKFAGAFGSGGVLMLKAGESAIFCGDIPMDSFEGNFAFHLPEGKYTLRRAVFFDEALTPTDIYAEYSFEIKESKTSTTNFASARRGDIVTFGNYNGALEWFVIDENKENILLITKDCIEALPYHNERKKVTWESCDLRKWLNGDFIEEAFSENERKIILSTELENPDNKRMFGATGGKNTTDRVFLLSHDEVLECFPNGWNIYTEPTPSAEKNLTKYETDGREYWWWWTRSPGLGQDMATVVNGVTFGIGDDGLVVNEKHGVRPTIWVNRNWEEQEYVPEPEKENLTPEQPGTDKTDEESGAPVQIGEEHLIPYATVTTATLFNNTEKTAVESTFGDILREILKYENFENFLAEEETEISALGAPLTGVDSVEFARVEDGKKYSLVLYENGFVLRGSAVPENEQGKIWVVKANKWKEFKHIVADEFENAYKYIPYWFGLVNQKNILEVNAKHQNYTRGYCSSNNLEEDPIREIAYRLRNLGVASEAERFEGNKLPEITEEHIVLTVEFTTWTKYTIILTRTEVIMVSSDMNYGLRYKTDIDGYDYFFDFATEEGLINAVTG